MPSCPLCSFVTWLLTPRIFQNADHAHKFRLVFSQDFPQPPDGFDRVGFLERVVDI